MKINCKLKISTPNLESFLFLEKSITPFISTIRVILLPNKIKRFTLLKSPHVNKKSKEHFQYLRYQRLYYITFFSPEVAKEFLLKVPNDLNIVFKTIL
jgi:ribosomal protein S10